MKFGGDERIRTADLPRAKRTLYQLSYTPLTNDFTAAKELCYQYQINMSSHTFNFYTPTNFNNWWA